MERKAQKGKAYEPNVKIRGMYLGYQQKKSEKESKSGNSS